MGRDPTKVRIIKQVTNNVSFGKEPSPIKEVLEQARTNGSQLTKKNRAYFITKSDAPNPEDQKDAVEEMKRLNTKNMERSKSVMQNTSPESRILKFLKSGEFNNKSQKSLEMIKQIFGV